MTCQTTLTKKCGIFRQSVCDFDVLCLFTVHFGKKTAIFSSKSQSRMAMTTNSYFSNSLDTVQLTPRITIIFCSHKPYQYKTILINYFELRQTLITV